MNSSQRLLTCLLLPASLRVFASSLLVLRLLALGVLLLTAANALAMSSTSQVARRGKPVTAERDWPDGVLDLVNDPLRTVAWKPWFSEWPNDVNFYTFQIAGTNDVNRLIANLAAIQTAPPVKAIADFVAERQTKSAKPAPKQN
jgi:hypothetical protein